MHIPRNFFIALSGLKISDQITWASYYGMAALSQTLAYPFLTVQRRLEARSKQVGMLSNDTYKRGSFFSCFSEMIKTEGSLSLFRGYSAHMLAILFWMSLLPVATNFLMTKLPLYLDPKRMEEAIKDEK